MMATVHHVTSGARRTKFQTVLLLFAQSVHVTFSHGIILEDLC